MVGESRSMIVIENVEIVSLLSVWMLDPRLSELLLELRKKGYATARVKPRSLGGYDITFIEPNVAAIKGSTYILYNAGRRTITVEGPNVDELLSVFNEMEEILRGVGSDPIKGVLFYELRVKAKASGDKFILGKFIEMDDLGLKLSVVPISFVSAESDPNSTSWFHLDVRPIWTSWSDERVRYEIVLIYRDDKEKLINTLRNINNILRSILVRISDVLRNVS